MTTLRFHNRQLLIADEVMVKTLTMSDRAARSSAPVLLVGESGTGKEMIARFIHEKSSRAQKPFVTVNCAAIPEGLMESELFGYERGSFTGAISQHIGKFEQATQGTLLLDEVSEMPINLQAKLLRVLQESEIDRIGGGMPISIDTRVIATTNQDPLTLISEGKFREDLYYRLNVARINCASLRNRKRAIVNLTQAFLKQCIEIHRAGDSISISTEAMEALCNYHWPGNIRELQNTIERAVLLTDSDMILAEDFELVQAFNREIDAGPIEKLFDVERRQIYKALDHTDGNRTHAAKLLGISVRTLRNKLKTYDEKR